MNINSIGSYQQYPVAPNFKGKGILETYDAMGGKVVQEFVTRPMQDYALKVAVDSSVGKGISDLQTIDNADFLTALLENITGLKIKKATQPRGFINHPDKITFRDLKPENDGICLTISDLELQ